MNDRELLELAANAAGINIGGWSDGAEAYYVHPSYPIFLWNPLNNDGDALRLVVDMDITLSINRVDEFTEASGGYNKYTLVKIIEPHGEDRRMATRRAIVRAAAEIGKSL